MIPKKWKNSHEYPYDFQPQEEDEHMQSKKKDILAGTDMVCRNWGC